MGTVPCTIRLKAINTQGRYGAVKTKRPRKLSLVSGFLRPQIYTRLEESEEPKNGSDRKGDAMRRADVAYNRSQAKCAEEWPDDSSRSREYLWRKKTWKRRSKFNGPK